MEILWKRTVSTWFWVIRPKLYGNYAFPQNFYARKFGENSVFVRVKNSLICYFVCLIFTSSRLKSERMKNIQIALKVVTSTQDELLISVYIIIVLHFCRRMKLIHIHEIKKTFLSLP